ncbi:hypothetical protein KJ682_04995, partial [bacterium]|nr:hypothetical protein [bacterium]
MQDRSRKTEGNGARKERRDWVLAWLAAVTLLLLMTGTGRSEDASAIQQGSTVTERADLYDMSLVPRKVRKEIFRAAQYGKNGQSDRAVELLQEHLEGHPDQDHYLVRLHLAQNLGDLGRTEEALEQYRKSVELEPR